MLYFAYNFKQSLNFFDFFYIYIELEILIVNICKVHLSNVCEVTQCKVSTKNYCLIQIFFYETETIHGETT